jgi:hypothetical protein
MDANPQGRGAVETNERGLHPLDGGGRGERRARAGADAAAVNTVLSILRSPAIVAAQFDLGEFDALVALVQAYGDTRARAATGISVGQKF